MSPFLNSVRRWHGLHFADEEIEREKGLHTRKSQVFVNDITQIFNPPLVLCFDLLAPVHLSLHLAEESVLEAWKGERKRERKSVRLLLRTFNQQIL